MNSAAFTHAQTLALGQGGGQNMNMGQRITVVVKLADADGKFLEVLPSNAKVSWASDNTAVCTVTAIGNGQAASVFGVAPGKATVKAMVYNAADAVRAGAPVMVAAPIDVTVTEKAHGVHTATITTQ